MLILVIDDEVAIVELLAELLSDEGHQVQTTYDGRSALTLLHNGLRPQVIISDTMMPGMDELYRALRSDPELANIRVIWMSAGRSLPDDLDDPSL